VGSRYGGEGVVIEPAILEPVEYERVTNDAGDHIGWTPKKADRRRFEHGSGYSGCGQQNFRPVEPEESARPFDDVLAELEAWAIGDERLYRQLETLYADKPLIADRIARAAVNGAQNATLHDPTAFLASRLRR
jgi:hypothetical protein